MSWLTQETGIINQYHPALVNYIQPVRVVHPIVIHMFQNTHPTFFEDLLEQIREGKLSNELHLLSGEAPIRRDDGTYWTPRVHNETRHIEIHESFLSYLWCITYSVLVRYSETVDYPKINQEVGYLKYPISEEAIQQARDVFDYGRSLIAFYNPWDKQNLPNPEVYLAEKRTYVERTNLFYTEAVKFILCHEFTHLVLHVDKINAETPASGFLDFEYEADNKAIDMMLEGRVPGQSPFAVARNLAIEIGIVYGILAMFYFRATTNGVKHPNSEDRLTNALERMDIDEDHYAWGFSCVGLQMWDEQFGLALHWNLELSNKDQYYAIVEQIKRRQ